MIALVTGGSASGKSEFAENLAVQYGGTNLMYIATMMPYDEECVKRIKKHQKMRKDKGFNTLECYTDLKSVELMNKPTVLLECMSNLLANEMFSSKGISQTFKTVLVCEEIMEGIAHLSALCENVIIVSNEVFSDNGSSYEETAVYISYLGKINLEAAKLADKVYEVVCGIPVVIKEREAL